MIYVQHFDGSKVFGHETAEAYSISSLCSLFRGEFACNCGDTRGCIAHGFMRPHFAYPDFVGPDAFREVVEAWYQVAQGRDS